MLQVGSILGGRLRIDRLLGAGGMGIVVAATHLELRQEVAVKVLRDELAENPTIVERFLREARAVARLHTEHVCRVFDVGRLDSGAPYIVMELLAGSDLGTAIARGPLPVATAVEYIVQACVAIGEAHAAGIIHRDLKPANLFVTRRPDGGPLVKVLDFGIAKAASDGRLTATASMMGSPGYMSPEQLVSARDVDVRTDIWALGVTLYQLVSGKMPFPGTQLADIAVKVQTAAPVPLDGDPELAAVVMRCLEKDPARRFADVPALVAALLPFGGASARRFAGAVPAPVTLAGGPVTAVGKDAPTVASGNAIPVSGEHETQAPRTRAPSQGTRAPSEGTRAPSEGTRAPSQGTRAPSEAPVVPVRRGRGAIVAVAGVLLVGGGVAAGWLMRGHDAAPPPSTAPEVARAGGHDAAAVAVVAPPDAPVAVAVVTPDAGDPWAVEGSGHEAPPVDAATSDADATPSDAEAAPSDVKDVKIEAPGNPGLARFPGLRQQTATSLGQMERMLPYFAKDPKQRRDFLKGLALGYCAIGDARKAATYYKQLTDAHDRSEVLHTCKEQHVTLTE